MNINTFYLLLKDCIHHLKNKQQFIPFRRSLLTLLLKDMFNGKSTISMICTISFHQPLYQQIDSMRYITDIKDGAIKLEISVEELPTLLNFKVNGVKN